MRRLVLAGAGHAHAQVLLDWVRAPVPGVELVVVSPHALAPYSGMVPGWLAGTYRFDEIVIDFRALCTAAGARWIDGELHALDPQRRTLVLGTGETLGWDLLSLNVGSTVRPPTGVEATVLALRPLSQLQVRYPHLLERWLAARTDRPYRVTAVGGGAAGFEALLAVLARLRALQPGRPVHAGLVSRGTELLPGLSGTARRAALRALDRAGVGLQLGAGWSDDIGHGSDLVLWATGAEAHDWQLDPDRRGALAVSARGEVRIDRQLRSVSHPQIYAVGDCAAWAEPLPKAGVYAVRMGPVLSDNLRAALGHTPARAYRPQHGFLALLATADGRAIASRGPFGAEGRWAWHWKDRIDRGFIRRFAVAGTAPRAQAGPTDPLYASGDQT